MFEIEYFYLCFRAKQNSVKDDIPKEPDAAETHFRHLGGSSVLPVNFFENFSAICKSNWSLLKGLGHKIEFKYLEIISSYRS